MTKIAIVGDQPIGVVAALCLARRQGNAVTAVGSFFCNSMKAGNLPIADPDDVLASVKGSGNLDFCGSVDDLYPVTYTHFLGGAALDSGNPHLKATKPELIVLAVATGHSFLADAKWLALPGLQLFGVFASCQKWNTDVDMPALITGKKTCSGVVSMSKGSELRGFDDFLKQRDYRLSDIAV